MNKQLAHIEINEPKNIKQIFKFEKVENKKVQRFDDLIQISWESLDMKAKGILDIKEKLEKFEKKIYKSPVIRIYLHLEKINNFIFSLKLFILMIYFLIQKFLQNLKVIFR